MTTFKTDRSSLRLRVFSAGGWAMTGHVGALGLRLIGSIILTRIFAPDVFGVLTVLTTISVVIALLTDIGLSQGVIRSANGSKESFLNTAWTVQILRGAGIWIVGCLISVGLYTADNVGLLSPQSVYATPNLPQLIPVAMLNSIILGFQSMKAITASRDLNVRRVIFIELFAQAFHLLATIVLGWTTQSIWSYVVSGLLASSLTVLLSHLWLFGAKDRIAWDREALAELSHFGKWVFLSSAIGAAASNGDRLLLAGWLTAAQLGYFSLASNLASIGEGLAGRLFSVVALPALSEIGRERPEQFSQLYLRLRMVTDSALVTAAGFLFGAGPAIVYVLYDPRYQAAGWFLQWLSFHLIFVRYQLAQSAYFALGRSDFVTMLSVTKTASIFVFIPGLYYLFGVQGAVVGAAFHLVPSSVLVCFLNRRYRLNSLRLELLMIAIWACGWGAGILAGHVASVTKAAFTASN